MKHGLLGIDYKTLCTYIEKQKKLTDLSRIEMDYAFNDEHKKTLEETYRANKEMLKLMIEDRNRIVPVKI